jgi:KTSC domain
METENMNIEMKPVESSQISAIGYDATTKTLAIKFKGGGSTYHYDNVPANLYEDMQKAKSVGSFFYKEIKPKSDLYPYKKQVAETKAELSKMSLHTRIK